jgi:hypothetical protein
MRQIKFSELIGYSYNRAVLILFKDFSLKKWLCLLLIAYLSGAAGSGGNFNWKFSSGQENESEAQSTSQEFGASGKEMVLDVYTGKYVERETNEEYLEDSPFVADPGESPLRKLTKDWPSWFFWLAGIGILLALALMIFFTWLASRFKFVWFNAIVNNTAAIKEPFSRYRLPAASLFQFFLIVSFAWIAVALAAGYWIYRTLVSIGAFSEGFEWSFSFLAGHFGFLLVVFVVVMIVMAILFVCIEHFVVPIMAMEACSFTAAVRKFWSVTKGSQKDFWLYLLVLIGLGIVTTIAAGIMAFIMAFVVLLAGGVIFGVPYLLIAVLLKLKWLFVVFVVIAGLPFAVTFVLLIISLGLPFHVFFKCFSLYFLSSLNCGYQPLALAQPNEPLESVEGSADER